MGPYRSESRHQVSGATPAYRGTSLHEFNATEVALLRLPSRQVRGPGRVLSLVLLCLSSRQARGPGLISFCSPGVDFWLRVTTPRTQRRPLYKCATRGLSCQGAGRLETLRGFHKRLAAQIPCGRAKK